MTVVVDASVAVKWFVEDTGSDVARMLLDRRDRLIAPELVIAEVSNALWRLWMAGRIGAEQADLAAARVGSLFDELCPMAPLAPRALALARSLNHSAYDCFYLSLAEAEKTAVITHDARLVEKLKGTDLRSRAVLLASPA